MEHPSRQWRLSNFIEQDTPKTGKFRSSWKWKKANRVCKTINLYVSKYFQYFSDFLYGLKLFSIYFFTPNHEHFSGLWIVCTYSLGSERLNSLILCSRIRVVGAYEIGECMIHASLTFSELVYSFRLCSWTKVMDAYGKRAHHFRNAR